MKTILILLFFVSCNLQESLDSKGVILKQITPEPRTVQEGNGELKPTGARDLSVQDEIRQQIESIDQKIEGLNDRLRIISRDYQDSEASRAEMDDIERQKRSLLAEKRRLESRLS